MKDSALVWLRREFRAEDSRPLFEATKNHESVSVAFVIDDRVLEEFAPGLKPHAAFFGALLALQERFEKKGKSIRLLHGDPVEQIPRLAQELQVSAVYCSRDYEPANRKRDEQVAKKLSALGAKLCSLKDLVLHEESEILSGSQTPYKVFTPYKNAVFKVLKAQPPEVFPEVKWSHLKPRDPSKEKEDRSSWEKLRDLVDRGNAEAQGQIPETGEKAASRRLERFIETALADYPNGRNLPAIAGTSRLSMDLRSGALSPRQIWMRIREARELPPVARATFLSELVWRDFFHSVGFHFPEVFSGNFNRKFESIRWRNDRTEFKAWCEGRTGYPIVDAGMRELVSTGFMHNRVRMITAMFLTKDLLIDWKWGEAFFRQHLIDGDLPVNNGNWQWSASTGCDAQPYFRIFNPTTQGLKFDREGAYIRAWVPELASLNGKDLHEPSRTSISSPQLELTPRNSKELYPSPIVDHAEARLACLLAFKAAAPGAGAQK